MGVVIIIIKHNCILQHQLGLGGIKHSNMAISKTGNVLQYMQTLVSISKTKLQS